MTRVSLKVLSMIKKFHKFKPNFTKEEIKALTNQEKQILELNEVSDDEITMDREKNKYWFESSLKRHQ